MSRETLHIVKNRDGGWAVKKGGSSRATKIYDTQERAIAHGRRIAKSLKAEIYIHGKDGRIRQKDSYRLISHPSKNKE